MVGFGFVGGVVDGDGCVEMNFGDVVVIVVSVVLLNDFLGLFGVVGGWLWFWWKLLWVLVYL